MLSSRIFKVLIFWFNLSFDYVFFSVDKMYQPKSNDVRNPKTNELLLLSIVFLRYSKKVPPNFSMFLSDTPKE